MRSMKRSFSLSKGVIALVCSGAAVPGAAMAADLSVSNMFNDHAVLQQNKPVAVWGSDSPGQAVTVQLGDLSHTAMVDSSGHWQIILPPQTAGGPFTLKVSDQENHSVSFSDVMLGEVWFCAGQSNMEFKVREAESSWKVLDAPSDPTIRLALLQKDAEPSPLTELKARAIWAPSTPESAKDFSAACYYMGQALQHQKGVTVGLIQSTWGGSWIQGWMASPDLSQLPRYQRFVGILDAYAHNPEKGKALWENFLSEWWTKADPVPSKAHWEAEKFDDSRWKSVQSTSNWAVLADDDFRNINSLYWYRSTITLTQSQADKARRLSLSKSHGTDTTWVNGKLLGRTEGYDIPRDYDVPPGFFKAGKNVIAVRVADNGGGGGLYRDPTLQHLALSDGQVVPLAGAWKYKITEDVGKMGNVPQPPWTDRTGLTTLYNGMVAPIGHYAMAGVAWFQGESNVSDPPEYSELLPSMISSWRGALGEADLPFLIVQLSSYGAPSTAPGKSGWAELRDVQRHVAAEGKNVGLITSIDIGDRHDIHFGQKAVLGDRLAAEANAIAYRSGHGASVMPTGATRLGNDIVVTFKNAASGLKSYSSAAVLGFETCTAPDQCQYTEATADKDTVVLKGANRPDVVMVRYAWSDAPVVNLFTGDDLPVTPFAITLSK